MADIQTVADRLETATIKAENAADTLDQIVEGDVNTTVVTAGAKSLPSIEKWYNDNFASLTITLNAQVALATQKAAEAAASALEAQHWAIEDEDTLVPEGNNVDEYSALHHRNKADDAQTASEAARDIAISEASDAADSATEAENWANTAEDVLVPEGNQSDEYSAKHHAIKADDSATEAENWANYAEDTLVPEGNQVDEYSAKHHRNKAEDAQAACEAIEAGLAASVEYGGDWSAVGGTTPSNPTDGSFIYRISAAGTINSQELDINDLLYFDQDNDVWRGIKNGYNLLLSDIGGFPAAGGTMTGTLEVPEVNINGEIVASAAALQVNGFMRTGHIYLHEGASPTGNNKLLDNNSGDLRWDSDTIWHTGNFDPTTFSTNPTYEGVLSFSSDEESIVNGTIERVQDNGDTGSGSSFKTVMINGGEHVNGTAFTNWKVFNPNVDAQGIILSNQGLQYGEADASTSNENVNATIHTVWHSGNDGASSGLDADTVDGIEAAGFAQLGANNLYTNDEVFRSATDVVASGSFWRQRVQSSNGDYSITWYNGSTNDTNREFRFDWTDDHWEMAGGLQVRAGDLTIADGQDIIFSGPARIDSNGSELLRDYDNGNVALSGNGGELRLGQNTTTTLRLYTGDGVGGEAERGNINNSGLFTYDFDVTFTGKAVFNGSGITFSQPLDMSGNIIDNVARLDHTGDIILRPDGTGTNKFNFSLNDLTLDTGVDLNVGGLITQTEDGNNLFTGNVQGKSFSVKHNSNAGYISSPGGAFFQTTSGSLTGAIKIALPVHGSSDMLSFYVDIYDYANNESVSLHICGYLYQTTGNNEWANNTVTVLTDRTDKDYTVRFGADGVSNCLWIGETSSSWSYPQVVVRDFYCAYTANVDSYLDGWAIAIVGSFDTVDDTVTGNLPASDWSKINNLPSTFSPSSHTHTASDINAGTLNDARLPNSQSAKTFSGNSVLYGTDTSGNYTNSPIELREVNQVGAAQSGDGYAPAVAWHWSGQSQIQLALHADGELYLRDGNTLSNLRNFNCERITAAEVSLGDNSPVISENGNYVRVQTSTGYIDMGSNNSTYAHFYTDRSSFYFDDPIRTNGNVIPHTDNARTLGTSSLRWLSGFTVELDSRRGVNGSYAVSAGTGNGWGSTIWGMGPAYDGTNSGSTYDKTGVYGISWLRSSHASALAEIGEGLYVYQNGSFQGGIGTAGLRIDGNSQFNGNVSVSGTVDGRDVGADGSKLDGIETNANNYSHPTYAGDDINLDTGVMTGAEVISDLDFNVTTNSTGHVTDANATYSTRNLTAADVGALATGGTAANSTQLASKPIQTTGDNRDVIPYIDSSGNLYGMNQIRFADSPTSSDVDWYMYINSQTNSALYFSNDANITRYEFTNDGEFRADADVVAYYSDERLKDIKEELSGCMDAVNSWTPIRYTATQHAEEISNGAFKSDKVEIGLSAQKVKETHPEIVPYAPFDRNEKGESISGEDYLTLKYERTVPVLVGALQEKDKEIQELRKDMEDMKKLLVEAGLLNK